jgi:hypothetical protein
MKARWAIARLKEFAFVAQFWSAPEACDLQNLFPLRAAQMD